MINFAIIGPGRCGSHMLITALKEHPQIHCLGEIFLRRYVKNTYIPRGLTTVHDILDDLNSSCERPVAGCSILYNELFSPYNRGVIAELVERQFRIIHLTRANLLRRFLSNKIAFSTNVWVDTGGDKLTRLNLKVSGLELFLDINRTLRRTKKVRSFFAHLPVLEIRYEELCADFPENLARVCEFLAVPYQPLAPRTFKQENRSLREAITNYDRLKLLFGMSKHRQFFDD